MSDYEDYDDYIAQANRFREPGSGSALHPGKRIHPCPNCGEPNRLTARDKASGYQCDTCADQLEHGGY